MPTMSQEFVFFNDTATTEIYTLSLHDALPISFTTRKLTSASSRASRISRIAREIASSSRRPRPRRSPRVARSEEHTSELQSRQYLVCRLLLEKKNLRSLFHDYRLRGNFFACSV